MLRLFFACYFSAVGISVPFMPLHYRGLGLSGRQVSWLLAVAPVLHLGVPLAWGWLADRTRRADQVLRLVLFGAAALILPLLVVRTMPGLLVVVAAHQFFAVAVVGLTDALALDHVRHHGADYGRIRFTGSLSFAVTCVLVGAWLGARGVRPGDTLIPALMSAALGLAFLSSLTLRGHGVRERPHLRDVRVLVADRRFLFLLVLTPLHWASSAPYHGFFAILLQDRGISPTVVGQAFMVSAIGEILAFYYFTRLRTRLRLSSMLALVFSGSSLRWLAVAYVSTPGALVAAQALHTLTFGLFWAAALHWVSGCVPPRLRATGQTLYTSATFGIGNVIGMLGTGAIYDQGSGAAPAFLAAAGLELVPLALVLIWGRRLEPAAETKALAA